ncbi:cyclopropane-fatty-acyl-phospholipid synthase [Methylohalomonas lacus]|uniref:Cyclopropane-fatty-acyl-phospholipid synthase n=1 Tax=Methylohalomonas lacus TaxID=398773 RepID=A0AAE3L1J6_9GAMM|nr:cyclopropane fatty acyl phospholipid synthase [Methylohalomonas lacus]MCS3903670.1 cyclopropane-fatty-acyl-phospholipid synthase [Methylohalomonas lacus]
MSESTSKLETARDASRTTVGAGLWTRPVQALARKAGITINGDQPGDIQVYDRRFFRRSLLGGSLAFGEAYMDGWWDAERLDECLYRLLSINADNHYPTLSAMMVKLRALLFNLQAASRAFQVGEAHYDIGNDFFRAMLDQRMVYTCGYWPYAHTLDEAQEHKLELVCRKLDLKPGQRVLDIGCGWGSFARYAAEHYDVHVTGLTISKEQAELARAECRGLPVEIRLQDYRDCNDTFDHIVSLGMFEHVGYKNYGEYMDVARRCLSDDGLFLLHTIGKYTPTLKTDPWIARYIFPNGQIPALRFITRAIERRFVLEDLHNFGPDYDRTLMAWYRNFHAAWPQFSEQYGERFYRMWKYYLSSCAAAFRTRELQLWQFVLSKHGVASGYRRPAY